MTFLDFPRYSGYIWQVRWTICKIFTSNFLRIYNMQKSLKSVKFWQSYSKNKKWTFFGHGVYRILLGLVFYSIDWIIHYRRFHLLCTCKSRYGPSPFTCRIPSGKRRCLDYPGGQLWDAALTTGWNVAWRRPHQISLPSMQGVGMGPLNWKSYTGSE